MSKAYLLKVIENLKSINLQNTVRDVPAPFPDKWPTRIVIRGTLLKGKQCTAMRTLYLGKPSVSAFNFIHKKINAGAVIYTALEFDRRYSLWEYHRHYAISTGVVARFYFPSFALGDNYSNASSALTDELLYTPGRTRRWTKKVNKKYVYYSFIPKVSLIQATGFAKLMKKVTCKI